MHTSRRTFFLAAGSAMACAPIGAVVAEALQSAHSSPSDSLLFLDPELRDPALRIQAGGPAEGFNKAVLAKIRSQPAPASAPRLPQVPVTMRAVPGRQGSPEVTVFVINSNPRSPRPVILHTHGGGYILGSAESEVPYLQKTAELLDCVVVTVEYRLAPETTYRGSIEDNYAALQWVHANAEALGVDRSRIALMGESAGGGHAALLAQVTRDRGEIPLVLQALIYPMLDDRTGTTIKVPAPIGTVGWNAASNRFGWASFLGQAPGGSVAPRGAVPAREATLRGLAPAFIGVGAVDLFVAEDIAYARRLIEAAVPTELLVVPGAFHGFDRAAPEAAVSRAFTKAKLNALRAAFGRPVEV